MTEGNPRFPFTRVLPSRVRNLLERIKSSPLGYRLAKGAFWSLLGMTAARLLVLVTVTIIARIIGKRSFGELAIIQSTVGMFGIFASFGMESTTSKYVAELRGKDPLRAGRLIKLAELISVISGAIIVIAFFFLAPWISSNVLAAPHLRELLQVGSVVLLCSAITSSQTGALTGFEAFKVIAKINVITGSLSFLLSLCGVYLWGLSGVVFAMAVAALINLIINHYFLTSVAGSAGVGLKYKDCFSEWRIILHFSLPAVLSGVLVGLVNWMCSAMIVNRPHGYEEMGIFNAANQWRAAILFLPTALASVLLPILSNLLGENRHQQYSKMLKYNMTLNGGLTLFLATVISISSPFIMSTYGKEFTSGTSVLILLAFSAVLMATINVVGQAIASYGRMWVGFVLNLVWACILVGGTWLLLDLGALGFAIAILGAYLLHMIFASVYVYFFMFPKISAVQETV